MAGGGVTWFSIRASEKRSRYIGPLVFIVCPLWRVEGCCRLSISHGFPTCLEAAGAGGGQSVGRVVSCLQSKFWRAFVFVVGPTAEKGMGVK